MAKEFSNAVIASLGFVLGCGYSVEMISSINDNNIAIVHGVQIPKLKEENYDNLLNEIISLSLLDIYLRYALFDYTRAITSQTDCAFLCYKAIETIRSHFGRENEGWRLMHNELGTTRDIFDEIGLYATPSEWFILRSEISNKRKKQNS